MNKDYGVHVLSSSEWNEELRNISDEEKANLHVQEKMYSEYSNRVTDEEKLPDEDWMKKIRLRG